MTIDRPDAATILAKQSCGNGSCRCAFAARKGSGLTHCSAHPDPTPSLNVTPNDSVGVLVRCHGGCSNADVIASLRSLGVWPDNEAALPVAPRPHPVASVREPDVPQKIVAVYDYRDGSGKLLFQTVRYG